MDSVVEAKVRPERALSATVIAASVAVSSSPMSAATAGMIAFISSCDGVTLGQLMAVLVPTFFLAAIITSLSIFRRWTHRRRRHSWWLMDDGNDPGASWMMATMSESCRKCSSPTS